MNQLKLAREMWTYILNKTSSRFFYMFVDCSHLKCGDTYAILSVTTEQPTALRRYQHLNAQQVG